MMSGAAQGLCNDLEKGAIEGVIAAVVFSNPENGYAIVRLEHREGTATAAGTMPGVSVGENVMLGGSWVTHPQYGQQFKAESFVIRQPSGIEDIFRYLSSGAVKNIGPAKARDIVDRFGTESLHVIENEPEKLSVIKGLSLKKAYIISEGFRRQAGLRRLIDFLAHYGIKQLVATRVYKDYGDDALEAVKENPYLITAEGYGAAFSETDAIALDLGFESDCQQRVSAAVIFGLTHNLSNGHIFIPKSKLCAATEQLLCVGFEAIEDAIEALSECGDIVIENIAGEQACYLRQMHEAEYYTAERISAMAKDSSPPDNLHGLIGEIEKTQGIKYARLQLNAIELAAKNGVVALTGGPGTGKTTTVRGVLMLFDALGLKTALCAPTGRAAKRLSETCKRKAATIHRLLGAAPGDGGALMFDHDEQNPLKADAVIVDESSMIDIMLMSSLLSAMKNGSRLVMVGDANQLPSVGPGNVFADIIRSGTVPTAELTEIFRQASGSGIVRCAHDVNNGIMPDLAQKYPDMFFLRRQTGEQIAETIAQLLSERLPRNMDIDPSQIQVLSPTRKREAGTVLLNEKLREAVNPAHPLKKEKKLGDFVFRTGDKVMQIRNNYDIMWTDPDGLAEGTGVFNGDIGRVIEVDLAKETLTVDFEDKIVTYMFEQLPDLEPAFAMTVHKSQGSEYQAVILSMTQSAPALLSRSVLYTAMTRAKELLVIVGHPDVMAKMVVSDRQQKRYSALRARLAGESGK